MRQRESDEWIQEMAEELAQQCYGKCIDSLDKEIQDAMYQVACDMYVDQEAARIDAAYNVWKEQQLGM